MRHHSRDPFRPNDTENVLPRYYRVTKQDGKNLLVVLLPTVPAAGGPLLNLPTAQAGGWNIPNLSRQEGFTILTGHHVQTPQCHN